MRFVFVHAAIAAAFLTTAPALAQRPSDDARVHQRADLVDARINQRVDAGRLSRAKAERLHVLVGQVHTEAGNLARTNGRITPQEKRGFDRRLSAIEKQVAARR